MTFQDGWLRRQVLAANEEINRWTETKREVMLREEQPEARILTAGALEAEEQDRT